MTHSNQHWEAQLATWMTQASEAACPHRAVQQLLDLFCEHVGADLCIIVKIDTTQGDGAIHWRSPAATGATDSALASVAHSLTERVIVSGVPGTWKHGQTLSDPWRGDESLRHGVIAPLMRGEHVYGSLGVYFRMGESASHACIDQVNRIAGVIWPFLRWDSVDGHGQTVPSAPLAANRATWAHQLNNVLGTIVLHADLALSLHKQPGDQVSHLLEQICAETIRCAQVVQQFGSE